MIARFCEMHTGEYDWISRGGYLVCHRPAKFRVPGVKTQVEYVCGIHANSLNKMYKRIGQDIRCMELKLQED